MNPSDLATSIVDASIFVKSFNQMIGKVGGWLHALNQVDDMIVVGALGVM